MDDLLDLLDAGLQVDLFHGDAVRLLHLGDVTHPGLQDADSGLEVGLRLGQLTGIGLGQAELVVDGGHRSGWGQSGRRGGQSGRLKTVGKTRTVNRLGQAGRRGRNSGTITTITITTVTINTVIITTVTNTTVTITTVTYYYH